jgi:DNA modification methylase
MKEFSNQIILGDSLEILKNIPDNYVDLVITSPPYFQQRDYGNDGKGIGNERTEIEYLNKLLAIFKESIRVTKTTGTIVYKNDKFN